MDLFGFLEKLFRIFFDSFITCCKLKIDRFLSNKEAVEDTHQMYNSSLGTGGCSGLTGHILFYSL